MSDDLLLAMKRAREVVGDSVWVKLSDKVRTNAIREELRIIEAEHAAMRKSLDAKTASDHVETVARRTPMLKTLLVATTA
jgi:hypothetical protein